MSNESFDLKIKNEIVESEDRIQAIFREKQYFFGRQRD